DPPLPRRRRSSGVSRGGLLMLGGLALLLVVVIAGIAWKVARNREVATQPRETEVERKADRSRPLAPAVGPRPPAPREDAARATDAAAAAVLRTVLVALGVIGFFAVIVVVALRHDVCPRCGEWRAVRCLARWVSHQKKCFGIVIRRGYSTSRGMIHTG